MIMEVMEVGDRVRVCYGKENLEWGCDRDDIQGKIGVVEGFGEIDYGRANTFGVKPGIYRNRCWANVRVRNKVYHISSCHLEMIDTAKKEKRWARVRANKVTQEIDFLRDLPDTKFWEWDIVACPDFASRLLDYRFGEKKEFVVGGIEYHYIGQFCNDGVTPMPPYRLRPVGDSGLTCNYRDTQLTLIRRGNIWKHYHGKKVIFANLQEECALAEVLNQVEHLKNPVTGNYAWTLAEVLKAIKSGYAHGLKAGHLLFSDKVHHTVLRFTNEDLGRRVKEETLKGFANHEALA